VIAKIKKIISDSHSKRSYQTWFYRSAPFKLSSGEIALGKELSSRRLKFWRKKYLDGRHAGKVLLVHMGLDRMRYAYYRNDVQECFKILGEMKATQEELGIHMLEIDQIEKQILTLQKKVNAKIRDPEYPAGFKEKLIKALMRKIP
jgi:hypothetical protein